MASYSMTCTCGHVMTVEADNRDQAVGKLQGLMTPSAIEKHYREMHQPSERVPAVSQLHGRIAEVTQPAA
jgi:hypothetical protein